MPNSENSKLIKRLSYEDQIQEMIREKVISGAFAPGEKIPSSRKIAADLGTNSFTVHKALNVLRGEGLLISSIGKGTFVRKREEKITRIGIYSRAEIKEAPFSYAVNEALRSELHEDGIELDLWFDPRPRIQHSGPWAPLVKAAEECRIQAFIGTNANLPLWEWQRKLPVPMAFLGATPSFSNNVLLNTRQFVEAGLRELVRQGCRTVGFIAPHLSSLVYSRPSELGTLALGTLEHFTDVASDLGLIIKNDWMRVFHPDYLRGVRGVRGYERFGHEEFLKIWSLPEKPEGLLVENDVIARGVILAIREKQVRVPEELKLATGKNESIDLYCPMPATFVVASEREIARALIEQVQKQFRGESCERISLPFKIVAHNNP